MNEQQIREKLAGMGNQYIMGGHLFDPSPLGIVSMVGTLIVLIACLALRNKDKNKSKAIKEFLSAACLTYSAVILGFCIAPVALLTATNNLSQFKSNVLDVPGTVFTGTAVAVVIGVVLLACAAVKCCTNLIDNAIEACVREIVKAYGGRLGERIEDGLYLTEFMLDLRTKEVPANGE